MFHTSVFENRKSDLICPPTMRCHAMNADDEITAKARPSGSTTTKFASPEMTSGPNREAVKKARVSETWRGMHR